MMNVTLGPLSTFEQIKIKGKKKEYRHILYSVTGDKEVYTVTDQASIPCLLPSKSAPRAS